MEEVMTTTDTLERWEYVPAAALFVAAGLNTGLWYVGPLMPDAVHDALPWLVTIVGVVAILAIDGSLIATIAGMRQGRRNRWSQANIFVTALFTALAALSAHSVLPYIGPALHALFAATIVTYAMHLEQPRADVGIALALREQELTRREADVSERLTELTKLHQAHVTIVNTIQTAMVSEPDKKQLVRQLVDSGATITAAAKQIGVTRQTASKYMNEGE
jgi:hypothetical protein